MTSFTNDSCPAGRPLASCLSLSTGESMLIHRDRHSRRRQRTKLFHLLLSFQFAGAAEEAGSTNSRRSRIIE
ncbi:hypothetical protein BJX65DRAFT_269086 [Aspergillus insuetus]